MDDLSDQSNVRSDSSSKTISSHKLQPAISGTHSKSQSGPIHEHELDWDGPDDNDNPLNWPMWKKAYVTGTTAAMCFCVSIGASLYVGGIPDLMAHTGASRELCIAGLSLYVLGLAFGPAIAAPISETFGRQYIYVVGYPISMLFTMGVGLSTKIRQVLILRFFSGLLASPALAVSGGTITDVWLKQDSGLSFAFFCALCFLGPVFGPIIGGFAGEHKGWQWTMWVSLIISGAILVPVLLLPETYSPVLLKRRAKKRGIHVISHDKLKVLKTAVFVSSLRPLQMLLFDPIVTAFCLYVAFVFAVLFAFFEAFPIIFIQSYGMDPAVSGLTFIAVGLGVFFASALYIYLDHKYFYPKNPDGTKGARDENGDLVAAAPERLLFLTKIGAVCLPISLFWLAWTARPSIHWICPTLAGVPFGYGLLLIFFGSMVYIAMSYPPTVVASVYGANNLTRYVLASAFPLFTSQMYANLDIHWATSLLAFISLALLPIPWVLERLGPRLRAKSRWGYASMGLVDSLTASDPSQDLEKTHTLDDNAV